MFWVSLWTLGHGGPTHRESLFEGTCHVHNWKPSFDDLKFEAFKKRSQTINRSGLTYLFETYWFYCSFFHLIILNVPFMRISLCRFGVRTIDYTIVYLFQNCVHCKVSVLSWILEASSVCSCGFCVWNSEFGPRATENCIWDMSVWLSAMALWGCRPYKYVYNILYILHLHYVEIYFLYTTMLLCRSSVATQQFSSLSLPRGWYQFRLAANKEVQPWRFRKHMEVGMWEGNEMSCLWIVIWKMFELIVLTVRNFFSLKQISTPQHPLYLCCQWFWADQKPRLRKCPTRFFTQWNIQLPSQGDPKLNDGSFFLSRNCGTWTPNRWIAFMRDAPFRCSSLRVSFPLWKNMIWDFPS